ncbi:MAG TPA: NFACT RNA binding domain-containing protein, partial [Candidatus Sulfotelmatobacter sp.]|nr:NFACT RNA binding domain-containing protein [Candidatus Sulfotelmatobacter sp.]
RDCAPFLPLAVSDVHTAESISVAVELSLGAGESRDAMAATRTALLAEIGRAQAAVQRKIAALGEGLQASQEAERVMQEGQLVLAYAYGIAPGAPELVIPDLGMTISLDPTLSAPENAERLFRRYRKLRDAQRRIPELLAEAQAQAERLHDLEAFAHLAESESELRELRRDLESGRPETVDKPERREKRGKPAGPLRFSLDGYTARVGRNARENEEVTFRLARRDDLWFHARERTGAHVVLHTGGTEPPAEIVEAAAQLAAHFSEGRADTQVDVDSTLVRNVRKIPGGPPGRVTYQHSRTVRVEPSVEGWQRG